MYENHRSFFQVYRLWVCLDIMCGVSSVVNLVLISIDRCVRIVMGLYYNRLFTPCRVKIMIIFSWVYAAVLASVKGVFFDWERPNYEILIFTMGFCLPLLVITICHCKIFMVARRQAKKVREHTIKRDMEERKDFKAVKMVVLIILAFIVCWCPFFLVNLAFGLCPVCQIPASIITVSKALHYANSFVNPIIYACMNKEFRSAFHALVTRSSFKHETNRNSALSTRNSSSRVVSMTSSIVSMISFANQQSKSARKPAYRAWWGRGNETCV